jgi:hypothetical protein
LYLFPSADPAKLWNCCEQAINDKTALKFYQSAPSFVQPDANAAQVLYHVTENVNPGGDVGDNHILNDDMNVSSDYLNRD